jgi:type I restriction enzyme, S subunit
MKQYEKYKASGFDWIGEIPFHWNLATVGRVTNIGRGRVISNVEIGENVGEFPVYSSQTENNGVMGYLNTFDFDGEYVTWTTDGANAGTVFHRTGKFNCTNVCGTIQPKNWEQIDLRFLPYFLNLGTRYSVRLDINPKLMNNMMANIPLVIPPKEEQIAIANYLDKKIIELDNLISQKLKLIAIVKEERIAITNTAVTKGLNARAKMKPSSVDWIGDIPEHWKVTRVKYVCTVQGRIGFKGYKSSDLVMEGEGALVLGATHITRDHKIDITEPVFLSWDKYYESPEIMVKQGDVVFTQRGAYLGKVALIDRDYKDVTINPSLILLKENLINSGYLTFYLTSHYIRKTIELISSNTAIPMISQENLSNFYCLVPPEKEQTEIFEFVNNSNTKIDLTISQIEKEIELMQEYRTALISEVVTGKIKVTA